MELNRGMDHVLPPEEDDDIPGFCRVLGVPGLADVHTHFLPPRLLKRVWEYFDAAGPLIGTTWPIRYKWTDAERVAHLRSMGVRLFKVHLQVGGFTPADPLLDEAWGLLSEARVPVVVHAGHAPVGTDHTGPGPFGALMARYPDLTAIVAHLGAPDYGEFLRMAAEYERVWLDTTMIFTGFFDRFAPFPEALKPLARELGMAGKILLGSDFPNLPYPYALQLAGLVRLGLGEDWLRAVCWDNPVGLFGLPEAGG